MTLNGQNSVLQKNAFYGAMNLYCEIQFNYIAKTLYYFDFFVDLLLKLKD